MNKVDLGAVTAYAMAVAQGYEGTEEEFAALQANSGNNALRAENAADRAQQILDSIPLDFQEVSQGVATLTEEKADKTHRYIAFEAVAGTRHETNNFEGLKKAKVVDADYQIVLYYMKDDAETSTQWTTEIDLTIYENPTRMQIRRADDGALDSSVSNKAVVGEYEGGALTFDDVTPLLEIKVDKANQFIAFGSNGTIRAQAVSIDGLKKAKVVDANYQISLYYLSANDTETNTAWLSEVNLLNYKKSTRMMIRRVDDGAMPPETANEAVMGEYWDGALTHKDAATVYVDCVIGDDTNDGLTEYTPFATIQKAIDEGYKRILVREGVYAGGISIYNLTDVQILINKSHSTFDADTSSNNPKVIIDCGNELANGVYINKCSDCVFEDIEVKNATGSGWFVNAAENAIFRNCVAHDCPNGVGFEIWNTNADFINCLAYNIGVMGGGEHRDGFNIHGTGTTNFVNCSAYNCEDDGISHHDACYGYVSGGEWYNCGKGGVCTPTHGAKVDVSGVYAHDCGYGIYAGNDDAALAKTFNITNCVCKNNANYDIYVTNNTANIWNCKYDTIQHSGVGANNIF